jgi:hypothetical protein
MLCLMIIIVGCVYIALIGVLPLGLINALSHKFGVYSIGWYYSILGLVLCLIHNHVHV